MFYKKSSAAFMFGI